MYILNIPVNINLECMPENFVDGQGRVNIGLGNGLVPDGTKPLPELMMTNISNATWPCDAIQHHRSKWNLYMYKVVALSTWCQAPTKIDLTSICL